MPEFDLPLEQLRTYLPGRREPQDWQPFWDTTLAETKQLDVYPFNNHEGGEANEQRASTRWLQDVWG